MPIKFSNVFYTYSPKSPLASKALNGVSFEVDDGSFTALVGRTGSGKSTIVQQINGLLTPMEGDVEVNGIHNTPDKKKKSKRKELRLLKKKVGLVFQFPEYQLFEDTVLKDVCFAPKNFGASQEEAEKAAKEALSQVGLGEGFYERSPFELSGGEKRRAAIAGILAFHPDILVVDEPTAGLDPAGAKQMMDLFQKIHEGGTTVLLVTHDMSLVLAYAEKVIVVEDGKIAKITDPVSLFEEDIEQYSLEAPLLFRFLRKLRADGAPIDPHSVTDVSSLAKAIANWKKGEPHA